MVSAHTANSKGQFTLFFNDMLISYDITPEELSTAYLKKHQHNMGRDFETEHAEFIDTGL